MNKNITHENQHIAVAVDSVICTIREGILCVLLIQMKKKPFAGMWALPGGLVGRSETLDAAAQRFLADQTAVKNVYLEQLYTFSDAKRDPTARVISTAYFALVPPDTYTVRTHPKYADVRWWPMNKLPKLAYDHGMIARYARQRLHWKLKYTNVAWSLLPKEFTLSELQEVYEAIWGNTLDKRNFRKKIEALDITKKTGKVEARGAHRPAALYTFRSRKPEIISLT